MPAKKKTVASKINKRGRPQRPVKKETPKKETAKKEPTKATAKKNKTPNEEVSDNSVSGSSPEQNGSSAVLANSSENTSAPKNEAEMIAELQLELQKAEQSKRVLYNALVRERSLNNDKPSVASNASKSGHNFCKPYSALSGEQKKERIRILASVVSEFADPKGNSPNKSMEIKFVMEALRARWEKTPADFQ